jgi:hypothetical protein
LAYLHRIIARNYNFIIVDFGTFDKEYLSELNRCIISVVVCGSKPWEMDQLHKVFDSAPEEIIKEFYYLFNFTDEGYKELIKNSMGELNKIHIANMTPDPFNAVKSPSLKMILKDYVPLEKVENPCTRCLGRLKIRTKNLINKTQESLRWGDENEQ